MEQTTQHRNLKNKTVQEVSVPSIGLGTYKLNGNACINTVEQALDLGYRHIDTAQNYENESEVGIGIAQSSVGRDEIFITTKIWFEDLDPKQLKSTFQPSLAKLKTDYIIKDRLY